MKQRIKSIRYTIFKSVGATLDNVVWIEGGLGSQLLAMMMFLTRRHIDAGTQADVSYFKDSISQPFDDANGLTRRPWELHRYGFELHEFPMSQHRCRIRLSASDQARVDQRFVSTMLQKDWSLTFPIVDSTAQALEVLGLKSDEQFACIHIRRGDYLRVASRVISIEETLRLSRSLNALLPEKVVFLSDDPFMASEAQTASEAMKDKQVMFLTDFDQHASHGLMRMASVLVTSNSTFSWSAGVLSRHRGSVVVSPQHFHGPGNDDTNRFYQSPSDWSLWS